MDEKLTKQIATEHSSGLERAQTRELFGFTSISPWAHPIWLCGLVTSLSLDIWAQQSFYLSSSESSHGGLQPQCSNQVDSSLLTPLT